MKLILRWFFAVFCFRRYEKQVKSAIHLAEQLRFNAELKDIQEYFDNKLLMLTKSMQNENFSIVSPIYQIPILETPISMPVNPDGVLSPHLVCEEFKVKKLNMSYNNQAGHSVNSMQSMIHKEVVEKLIELNCVDVQTDGDFLTFYINYIK